MVDSPTYLAGRHAPDELRGRRPGPAGLGTGRRRGTAGRADRRGHPVDRIRKGGAGVELHHSGGIGPRRQGRARRRTSSRPLLRRLRLSTVPVYDYVLATEPLTDDQLAALAGTRRSASPTRGNQFHYYRLTAGPPDPVGRVRRDLPLRPADPGRRTSSGRDVRRPSPAHLSETFPQLGGFRFSHRWAGAIDTSTRFCAFYGSTHGGRVAVRPGFTGLGVGASRFAADVMLDLLAGEDTERTRLEMVRTQAAAVPARAARRGSASS